MSEIQTPHYSVNKVHNFLKAANAASKFAGAVVAADGSGDYTTIGAALTANERTIFVKNGTYTETTDLTLGVDPSVAPLGTTIHGESKEGVLVNLGANQIIFSNDSTAIESAGTVTMVNGSKTITGSGTTFTNITDKQPFIIIDGQILEVASIETTISLTLASTAPFTQATGMNYALFGCNNIGSGLSDMTIASTFTTSNTPIIEVNGVFNFINNIRLESTVNFSVNGIRLNDTSAGTYITNSNIEVKAASIRIVDSFSNVIEGNILHGGLIDVSGADKGEYNKITNNTFYFQGGNLIQILSDHTNFSNNTLLRPESDGISITASFCQIRNNIIKSPGTIGINHNSGAYNVIDGNIIDDPGTLGLDCTDMDRCSVTNNKIKNPTIGIKLDTDSDKNTIAGNHIFNASDNAIEIIGNLNTISNNTIDTTGNSAIELVSCSDNTVSGNTITGAGDINISLLTAKNCTIADNICDASNGIKDDATSDNNIFKGNQLVNAPQVGIVILGDFDQIIANNIEDCQDNGIDVSGDNCLISSNTIDNPTGDGISISAGVNGEHLVSNNIINSAGSKGITCTAKNSSITGNQIISPTSHGIDIQGAGGIIDCLISNNLVKSTGAAAHGIVLDANAGKCVVSNNFINASSGNGIRILSSRNIVCGNSVIDSASIGITVANTYNTISNNTILNASSTGILLDTTTKFNTITGNMIHACSDDGIRCKDSNNTLSANSCNDNTGDGIDVQASRNIITGNQCHSNSNFGITITAGSTNSIVTSNVMLSNTSGQFNDAGTTTSTNNNITT